MAFAGKRFNGLLAGLFVLLVCCFAGSSAWALSPPPPPERAQIVFSNGGRIVSINADGSGRRELTNRGVVMTPGMFDRFGDTDPQASPDGTRILFTRTLDDGDFDLDRSHMISDRDGSGARRILRDLKRVSYDVPTWMPDGSITAVRWVQGKRKDRVSVVNTPADGGPVRTLVKLRPHLLGTLKRDIGSYLPPIGLAASPDGRKLLISMSDGYKEDHRWLELADLETGKRKNIAPGGYSGSWSPDGTKIAYAANRGNKGEFCDHENECRIQGDLFIADADGSNRKRIADSRADEDSPSWSPDGSRIAFSSNRNVPTSSAAAEIYSITPQGDCLTWLTNGSPASTEPSWVPSAGLDYGAVGCGEVPREPLIEARPVKTTSLTKSPRLWAGPSVGDSLLSGSSEAIGIEIMEYADCGIYDPALCPQPVSYASISSCFISGAWASVLAVFNGKRLPKRRGVVVMPEHPKRTSDLTVLSGGSVGVISQATGMGTGLPGEASLRANYRFFDSMRPLGSASGTGNLPALGIPRADLRIMRAVKKIVKRHGVRKAAKRLEVRPETVREHLRMPRMLKRIGRIKPMSCPADFDPFEGFSARSIEGQVGARLPAGVRRLVERIKGDA